MSHRGQHGRCAALSEQTMNGLDPEDFDAVAPSDV
jgi:hypothetical protein